MFLAALETQKTSLSLLALAPRNNFLEIGLPGTRTQNLSVKSRVLYH